MLLKQIATALALALAAVPASAATIVAWESTNTDGRLAATDEGDFVTQFSLGRSKGLLPNNGGTYNSRDWQVGGSKLTALRDNDALFWGFNSSQGYDLTSLSIGYDRSGEGPLNIAIDLFINNVFQGQIFSDTAVADNSSAAATIDLTAFDNIQNGFFRLVGWGAESTRGTFDIENRSTFGGRGIVLSGELTPVPLPAGLPLLLAGLGAFAVVRRRA